MGVVVLTLGAAAFFSLMPLIDKTKNVTREQHLALQMTNRMIDQLQMLKPAQFTPTYLSQLNLIDANQSQSPYSFSHIPLDESTRYSPAQALKNGTGTMTVTFIDSGSVMVTLNISWTSADKKSQQIQTGTVIGGYR